jgi:ParB-like chromosome segregation protein Spo0J
MKRESVPIARIYVPTKRRGTLNSETVQQLAQSIMDVGQQVPILVRPDGDRFVLVEGLHRLEACRALGETTIFAYLVQARKH